MSASVFYNSIPDAAAKRDRDLVSYFVYYLTVDMGNEAVGSALIDNCFSECDLAIPTRTRAYLSEGTSSEPQRYIKNSAGYRLERKFKQSLSATLGTTRVALQTSAELRSLESQLPEGDSKAFLKEAVDCFEAGANRAAIIMTWVLAMHHMRLHVFNNALAAFNDALDKNPDKKIKKVTATEHFSDMREEKFIELCRTARIISNDVMKILNDGLGARNSCAHPSDVIVARSKAIALIEDLVTNVIKKF